MLRSDRNVEARRDLSAADEPTGARERRPVQHVAKLAHVAGPSIARELRERGGAELLGPDLGGDVVEKTGGEIGQIGAPITQRRNVDDEYGEPLVEILTKKALGH